MSALVPVQTRNVTYICFQTQNGSMQCRSPLTRQPPGNATPITNGRRAVRSYCLLRALDRQERRNKSATRIFTPSGEKVTARFDL